MLNVENRTPYPGKEGRVRLRQDNGQIIEGVLEMADDATAPGTPWNRQSGRLLQADIRTYPISTGQTITQGDVVDVVDGSITRTLAPQSNVKNVLYNNSCSYTSSCTLSATRTLSVFGNSNGIYIYLLKEGSALSNLSVVNGASASDIISLSSDMAILSYYFNTYWVSEIVINSSDSLNQYLSVYMAPSSESPTAYCKTIPLSETTFLAVYGTSSGLRAKIGSVSGTTIKFSQYVHLSSNTAASYISATRLPDSGTTRRVCVCYSDGGNSNAGTAVIVSIDASNNVTFGSPVVFESSSSPFVASTSVTYNGENIVVCYSMTNNYAFVKTLSPSNLAEISNLELGSEFRANSNTLTSGQLGKTTIVTVGPSNSIALVINDSSSGLSIGGNFVFNSSLSQYISMVAVSSTEVVLAYGDNGNSSYGTATILTVEGNQIAGSFLDGSKDAIALQSGTSGQSIEVVYSGTVAADWVTAGQVINSDGVYGVGVLDGVLQVWSKDRPLGVQIITGSYVGTGKSGSGNPNSLTFPVPVDYVIFVGYRTKSGGDYTPFIQSGSSSNPVFSCFVATVDYTQSIGPYSGGDYENSYGKISEDGKTIFWYNTSSPSPQLNSSDNEYFYIAFYNGRN